MSKNVVSKAQLEAMLAEMQEKAEKLTKENALLRQGRRPADALCISTNLTFQKGTHQDLVGKRVKMQIPKEALGNLTVSGVAKQSKSGNVYLWATGWIDTSKLDLGAAVEEGTKVAEEKAAATESFASAVGLTK